MFKKRKGNELARHVSFVTILVNVVLAAFKLVAGLTARSSAMVSDAVHSASDVLTTVIVLIGLRISGKAADRDHPYGHDRFECTASIVLAFLLFGTGLLIGWSGLKAIVTKSYTDRIAPGFLALLAAIISIVLKEAMYWYTWLAAKKIRSTALKADAWHHRSDALSSIGALIGIAGARHGLAILDPLASLVICIFILKVAVDIFIEATKRTVDHACDKDLETQIRDTVLAQDGVKGVDELKTRQFSSAVYVDMEISVDRLLSLEQSHMIAEKVHSAVEELSRDIRHCAVHVNPSTDE